MANKYTSCTDCTHFYYDKDNREGVLYMACDKRHWNTLNINYEIDFRAAMRKALSCEDFKAVALWELETGLLSSDIGKPKSLPISPIDRQMVEAFKTNLELKRKIKNGRKKERG